MLYLLLSLGVIGYFSFDGGMEKIIIKKDELLRMTNEDIMTLFKN